MTWSGKTEDYFLTIARVGNLNQAARILYVSQPSLSKYIQRLEDRLGTPLFDRSTVPMKLNEAGELYYRFLLVRKSEEQLLLTQISELGAQLRGTLRLGIPAYCGQYYLPKILPKFSGQFPGVSVELMERTGDGLERALLDREIDVAVFHLPVGSEALSYRELADERILAVTHRSKVSECVILQELLQTQPLILPQPTQKIGKIVGRFLQTCPGVPTVYLRTCSVETTIRLAAEGLGTGFVPESGIEMLPAEVRERVSFYPLDQSITNWKIVAAYRKQYALRRYEEDFLRFFTDAAQLRNVRYSSAFF